MTTQEEHKLREEAEARVGFKRHLRTYIAVNVIIWLFWYIFRAQYAYYDGYWPVYSSLGWGLGLLSHFVGVYRNNDKAIEKELEKLKRERGLN